MNQIMEAQHWNRRRWWGEIGNGSSAIPLPSVGPLGSHDHVGDCVVVVPQCRHDFGVGRAVSVRGLVWLLAVGAADWGVSARVARFAVSNRTGVLTGRVWEGADCTGVFAGSTALGRMPVLLAFVALSGGAKGDVFGDVAFVKNIRVIGCVGTPLLDPFSERDRRNALTIYMHIQARASPPVTGGDLTHRRWVAT